MVGGAVRYLLEGGRRTLVEAEVTLKFRVFSLLPIIFDTLVTSDKY